VILLGFSDRDVSPVDAVGKRPQETAQASGFGRAGAICEYSIVMQILPRFERQRGAYKCIAAFLQYDGRRHGMLGLQGASSVAATGGLFISLPGLRAKKCPVIG
jgi:hypothetical protein